LRFNSIHAELRSQLQFPELVANCFFLNDDSIVHTMIWFSRLARAHRSYLQELTDPVIDDCTTVIAHVFQTIGQVDGQFGELVNALVAEVPPFSV
jgi:hypothetical protein